MNVVTSFSPRGWKVYGKRFVDTFLKHWPHHVRLDVFLEGQEVPAGYEAAAQWHDLRDDPEHEEFCAKYAGPEFNHPRDFNMMSVKFAHKVFAITSPQLPIGEWRIWIDADSETIADVTTDWLRSVMPLDKDLAFLGRQGVMRPGQAMYTECGFVAYNTESLTVQATLQEMRRIYTSGDLFGLGTHNWHDSYVFDHCRMRLTAPSQWHNLSAHCQQDFHPWPKTVLANVLVHQKGPKRKLAAYGAYT